MGFRIFPHHQLLRKKNMNKFERNQKRLKKEYDDKKIEREKVVEKIEGFLAYASHANTYKYRKNIIKQFNQLFPLNEIKPVQFPKKNDNFKNKIKENNLPFSSLKTLQLFKNRKSIEQIAKERNLKITTIYQHIFSIFIKNK